MSAQRGVYKTRFRTLLLPYLEMLRHKQKVMRHDEWLDSIERTHASILLNTEQYLGNDVPSMEIIEQEVSLLFKEFIMESMPRMTN